MSHSSRRPYLIRAIYEWACDNGLTPHILVAADAEGVSVPPQYIEDNRITLNIAPMAVQSLSLESDLIWFAARFSGKRYEIQVPMRAVLAIFARENGEGIVFGEVEAPDAEQKTSDPSEDSPPERPRPGGKPKLRLVK